jgi:hypothetical protein
MTTTLSTQDVSYREAPCPWCSGTPMLLGILGRIVRYRCRACGMDYRCPDPHLQEQEPVQCATTA